MGRTAEAALSITAASVEAYLCANGYPGAVVQVLNPLGQSTQEGLKAYGYGRPLHVAFTCGGRSYDVVVRTMSPDPFGHDRRADRVDAMVLAFDTFATIPRHIQALDVGTFDSEGRMVPMARGEPFLLTNFVEGELYAHDLFELASRDSVSQRDIQRAQALAGYLATLHGEPVDGAVYVRSVRDIIASGEGLFGQCDGYPDTHPIATAKRLHGLEEAAIAWRWKLRGKKHRARRTHGDFHPFNILFREGDDFSVLDCSRGAGGDPADDVTCLSVNYLFFALSHRGHFKGPERQLWNTFWHTYLEATGDREICEVVAPFFAWRLLVVASPVWYPSLGDASRDVLLTMAERLLGGAVFHPDRVDELLA